MCLIRRSSWVLYMMLYLVKGENESMSVPITSTSCINPDSRKPQQIFSIDVYANMRGPLIPILRKKMCITNTPNIDIRIGYHKFNLLNATISTTACREMYQKLICSHPSEIQEDECMYANQIMFAATQKIIPCESDTDCIGIRQTYEMPLLWCEWTQKISQHVCQNPLFPTPILQPCESDEAIALRIRDACIYTNEICAFIVDHVDVMSPIVGVGLFLLSFCIIFFSH